jgi:hypothetical protein
MEKLCEDQGCPHHGVAHLCVTPAPRGAVRVQPKSILIERKAFICTGCEGVYADKPVSSCDCCIPNATFLEGRIVYRQPINQ